MRNILKISIIFIFITSYLVVQVSVYAFHNNNCQVLAIAVENDFIMVGVISMLEEVEDLGGEFYEDGIKKDALEILSSNGIKYVRLRLWVDPYDEQGNAY